MYAVELPRFIAAWRVCPALRLLPLLCLALAPGPAFGQMTADGLKLTVATANAVATFHGPDLVGFTNVLTGEPYLRLPPAAPLLRVEPAPPSGQALEPSSWLVANQPGAEATSATLTMRGNNRSATVAVRVDPASQEIVITLSAQAASPGLSSASWVIAGLDLTEGRLVVPADTGIAFDQQHPGIGASVQYPGRWNAQMAVYEAARGSMVVYSTDNEFLFKDLQIGSRVGGTLDVSLATEAIAPWARAADVPAVEWRLKAFAGGWRAAAQAYRDWLAANRPASSAEAHAWVRDIRTVVRLDPIDPSLLDRIAALFDPAETMIYLPDWRLSAYDTNYPDYTPAPGVAAFAARAHSMGFKVMLHVDLFGVSPSNPGFAAVQQWQAKDPASLQPLGWLWGSDPATTQNRFAFINPAASAFRKLLVARIGAAVAAVGPDALHLDMSGFPFNDGNGLIEAMSFPQGAVQLHKDLAAAFPNLVFGGEGMNDTIFPYNCFAQSWWGGDVDSPGTPLAGDPLGHPITNFLFNSQAGGQIEYYGHLAQPPASDSTFVSVVEADERRGILPSLHVSGAGDLDLSDPDNVRLIGWLQLWQADAFEPNWRAAGDGALMQYQGKGNATATLTDTGTLVRLAAGDSPVYQRVHDAERETTTGSIANWPAFDGNGIYGLDPSAVYWLDSTPRPPMTHLPSVPPGIEIGPDTMIGPDFAYFDFRPVPLFDFYKELWTAKIGITYGGADLPLGDGATAQVQEASVGGVVRPALFMAPPWQAHAGGETFVEWQVTVDGPSVFSFSAGVSDGATCDTDGVTFRVEVNGLILWQQNIFMGRWVEASVDLSPYAGSTVRLRLVSNPGPRNDPNCDWASFSDLALTSVSGNHISVPMVFGPGVSASVLGGDGAFAAQAPGTGMVSGVPVPGRFVLFSAAPTGVTDGSALATLRYEVWKGSDGQMAAPGSVFNSGSVGTTSSDGVTQENAIFAHPPNFGRTILSWALALPGGEGLQLNWSAGLADGAQSDTGVQFSVRINGVTYWTFFDRSPSGWQPSGLDLSSWAGQNILVQLVTDSVGDNAFDWAWWAGVTISEARPACGPIAAVRGSSGEANAVPERGCRAAAPQPGG
jgi:hypothetical protein